MMNDIKTSFHRAHANFLQDAAGVAALVIMLVVALHLPGVV